MKEFFFIAIYLWQSVGLFVAYRPYYLLQSVNLPAGWETNQLVGISMAMKLFSKTN
jgi:hypothetical protein